MPVTDKGTIISTTTPQITYLFLFLVRGNRKLEK